MQCGCASVNASLVSLLNGESVKISKRARTREDLRVRRTVHEHVPRCRGQRRNHPVQFSRELYLEMTECKLHRYNDGMRIRRDNRDERRT